MTGVLALVQRRTPFDEASLQSYFIEFSEFHFPELTSTVPPRDHCPFVTQAYSPILSSAGEVNWSYISGLNEVQERESLHAANKVYLETKTVDYQILTIRL